MDEADQADNRIESAIEAGIEHARYMLHKVQLSPCGNCHYCGEGVRGGMLFCDDDCLADYRYEQKQKKIAGK